MVFILRTLLSIVSVIGFLIGLIIIVVLCWTLLGWALLFILHLCGLTISYKLSTMIAAGFALSVVGSTLSAAIKNND